MKSTLLLPLVALSALSLAACDNKNETPSPAPDATVTIDTNSNKPVDVQINPDTKTEVQQTLDNLKTDAEKAIDAAGEKLQDAGNALNNAGSQAQESIGDAVNNAGNAINNATDRAAEGLNQLGENAQNAMDSIQESLRNNPDVQNAIANMTDAQKIEAVELARKTALDQALAAGMTAEQAQSAADMAENLAKAQYGVN